MCSGLMGSDLRFGGFRVCGRLNRAAAASRGRQGLEVAGDGQGQVLLGGEAKRTPFYGMPQLGLVGDREAGNITDCSLYGNCKDVREVGMPDDPDARQTHQCRFTLRSGTIGVTWLWHCSNHMIHHVLANQYNVLPPC